MKYETLVTFGLRFMALVLLANLQFGFAQISASIKGRIEDPSGSAIPAASITIVNTETGAARAVSTDEAGNYRALSLPVGRYEIRTEKAGFKAAVQTGINLVVGQEAVVNLRLEVGEVQQQVTVTGEAPLVNTTTSSIAGLVGEKQVKDLPLNGRSFDNLITLNPGAISSTKAKGTGNVASQLGNIFSVAGRRPQENLFLFNGVEYTGPNQTHALPGGVSGQMLGIDAVREFNVVSDAYSAEYGKRAGAQVNVVTQSGTNQLHGAAFEFLRNSVLDARNFFDHGGVPPFKRNQFGAALGGPLQKDRTFLFGNYEGFRQRLGLSAVTTVPDENARRGLLPGAQGVPTLVPDLDPRMLPYMAFWPLPNGPNLGGGIALAFSNPKQSVREEFGTTRFDRTFSNKDSASGMYLVDDGFSLTPQVNPFFATSIGLRSQVLSLQEIHIFSPNVINTFTAGFSHVGLEFNSPPIVSFPASLSYVQGEVPGNTSIGGNVAQNSAITPAGSAITPHFKDKKSLFTYEDGMQMIRGSHRISLGVWFQRLRSNEFGSARQSGQPNFSSLQTFLQGTVASFGVSINPIPRAFRQLEGAWYLQDAIQVRSNLTLQFGLRHEFTDGWNEATGRASQLVFDHGVVVTNPIVGHSALAQNNSKWLFGPRVGLAWDPFGKGKTSIRAAFGTYYSLNDTLGFILKDAPPFNATITFQNVSFPSLVPIVPSAPRPPVCGPGVPRPCTTWTPQGIQPNIQTPTVEEWNFTLEQQLDRNMALRASYVGSHAFHQLINPDQNAIHSQICSDPGGCQSGGLGTVTGFVPKGAEYIPIGTRPNPFMANGQFYMSEGSASYNALQLDLTRRFSYGLQLRANYTWAKNLDINSGVTTDDAVNESAWLLSPYHVQRDHGRSAQDARQQFSFNGGYELPLGHGKAWLGSLSGPADKLIGGWQLNWIVSLLSGFPISPLVGSNRSGDGNAQNPDRPSQNPAFTGPVLLRRPNRWFNPNAYVLPVAGTYGNVGRGVIEAPGLASLDISMFKSTPLTERVNLNFRAEFFNILNRANFGTVNPTAFTAGAINPAAGIVTNTATTSRQIQFGMKLIF